MTASSLRAKLAGIAVAALVATPAFAAANAPMGNAAHGKELFGRVGCYECHGYEGQGGVGPRIAAPVPLTWPALSAFVRTTNTDMPPFTRKVLADQDLADIFAYLQTIQVHNDPKADPLLSQ
jgi:ubiquinol-cytochrome c reductase cytochrome c subunit